MNFKEALTDALSARDVLDQTKARKGALVLGQHVVVTDNATLYAVEYVGEPHKDGTVLIEHGVQLLDGWGIRLSDVRTMLDARDVACKICALPLTAIDAIEAMGKMYRAPLTVKRAESGGLAAQVAGVKCDLAPTCDEFAPFAIDPDRLVRASRRLGESSIGLAPGQDGESPVVLWARNRHAVIMPMRFPALSAPTVSLEYVPGKGLVASGWQP